MVGVLKTRNNGTWTEARFTSFVKSLLRAGTLRWGPKVNAKKKARYKDKLPNDRGRLVFHSVCEGCGAIVPETTSAVDHINPVVPPEVGFTTWDDFIRNLFCEEEGFQVLCESCHTIKTNKEKEIGKERRRRERSQS